MVGWVILCMAPVELTEETLRARLDQIYPRSHPTMPPCWFIRRGLSRIHSTPKRGANCRMLNFGERSAATVAPHQRCGLTPIANPRQRTERIDRRPRDVAGTVGKTLEGRLAVADRRHKS